jgi:hypothetical protein
MSYEEVIAFYGSVTKAAKAMRVSRPVVYRWQKKGVPLPYQALIEIETKGSLKVDRRTFNGS